MADPLSNSTKFTFGGQDYTPGAATRATQPSAEANQTQPVMDSQWVENFIREAPAKYGVTSAEAKYLLAQQMVAVADERNDETLLDALDPKYFTAKTQQFIADSKDKIFNERKAREDYQRKQIELAEKEAEEARLDRVNVTKRTALLSVARGERTVGQLTGEMLNNPDFEPDEITSFMDALSKMDDQYTDPAMEQLELNRFRDELIKASLGLPGAVIDDLAMDAMGKIRSRSGRLKLAEMMDNADKVVRDRLFEGLDPFFADVSQAFPSGVGDEQSMLATMTGDTQTQYYEPNVDTMVRGMAEENFMRLAADWYREYPEAIGIPYATKREFATMAVEWAIEDGRKMFANYTVGQPLQGQPQATSGSTSQTDTSDPLAHLKSLAATPKPDETSDHEPMEGVSAGRGGNR